MGNVQRVEAESMNGRNIYLVGLLLAVTLVCR